MTTHVLVLGAGFGGLELSSRISRAIPDLVDVTLIDRADSFVFGFSKLDVMFGKREPAAVRHRYGDLALPGVRFRQETITSIDPEAKRVTTDLDTYDADVLVVALGADLEPSATPGLVEHGDEYYTVSGAERLREVIPSFGSGTAIVGVTSEPFKCPPAPSEAAFLLDEYLRERGRRDACHIQVVMPFGKPIPPSPETSDAILAKFAERGIEWIGEHRVTELDGGEAVLNDGTRLPFDLFLGIPKHHVPPVVEAAGLAVNGWVPVDPANLQTRFPDVYAVGDVNSVGTPKAGVFAEGAARVAADHVIAKIREAEAPGPYDGRGACYVELGDGEVARVDVDFLSGPSVTGRFTEPSAQVAAEKGEFASVRWARWTGA